MEQYGKYLFEIRMLRPKYVLKGQPYYYKLYSQNADEVIISNDYYETPQEAKFAAIGHISLLTNGATQ